MGNVYFFRRRYEETVAQYKRALDLNPNLPAVRSMRAMACAMKHTYQQPLLNSIKFQISTKL
jgi:hypothetical protein